MVFKLIGDDEEEEEEYEEEIVFTNVEQLDMIVEYLRKWINHMFSSATLLKCLKVNIRH